MSLKEEKERDRESMLEYISCLNDPFLSSKRLLFSFSLDHKASFVLASASTRASEHEGISAAGADPLSRRWTPALDAEALVLGKTLSQTSLPVSPKGIVSPVVISRACLRLLKMETKILNCGSFHCGKVESIQFSTTVAECPSSGQALPVAEVESLFRQGLELGAELAQSRSHLVLAECVPGGTTTALALLTGLGWKVSGLVSSSLPKSNHQERFRLVECGIEKCKFSQTEMRAEPLLAVSALGDPMQAAVAGLLIAASRKIPVFLAGGSQMLAVWALARALCSRDEKQGLEENVLVLSTKWVAHDPSAPVYKLAELLSAPFAVACPDFSQSKKQGLRAYEEGNVKEGVGAGASICLARAAGFEPPAILEAIENCYDELVLSDLTV